jgi:hypothetical protein
MAATKEKRVFAFVERRASRAANPISQLITDDGATYYWQQPMEHHGGKRNGGCCGKNTSGNQQRIAGQKKADEQAGLHKNNRANK